MVTNGRPGAAPGGAVLARDRLNDRLARRFDVRLQIVTGGAGSGKTTAISQAIAQEAANVDIWYPCSIIDRAPGRLLAGIVEATLAGLRGETAVHDTDVLATLADAVLAASPRQVCLIVDDVHVLTDHGVFESILDALPGNGHLLLAGRRPPDLRTARLTAAGMIDRVEQHELLMTDEEQIAFANLRGIDIDRLADAEGWPAFLELAAVEGATSSRRYLEEEALHLLTAERRRALAAFTLVGGGDDALSRRITGSGLDELLNNLPLIRWTDDEARLHDLWGELLADELTEAERFTARTAAAEEYRSRGNFQRAIDLAVSVDAFDHVLDTMGMAVAMGVNGGLQAQQLRAWRAALPLSTDDNPVTHLLDALIEREQDPTSDTASRNLRSAADEFAAVGNHELQLVCLSQLGYLLQVRSDIEGLEALRHEMAELATRHAPATPFVSFVAAWIALTEARHGDQLAELESIDDAALPHAWEVSRRHMTANALLGLGRADEGALLAPSHIETLRLPTPGPLVTESQCLWHSGQPLRALAVNPAGLDDAYGARDRFVAGTWFAVMLVYAGDIAAAKEAVRVAQQHIGEQPSPLVAAQLFGVETLLKLARGDEDGAAEGLRTIMALAPLGRGVGDRVLRPLIPLPYVLTPETRDFWENASDLGPAPTIALSIARAFTRARETDDDAALRTLDWPDPGRVAATMPVRWAVEFALLGVRAGRPEARSTIAWLCEHWGQPARAALRSWVDDPRLGDASAEVLAHTPFPPRQQLAMQVLGLSCLLVNGDESQSADWRRERVRALLVLLTLRGTMSRDELSGLLWPDLSGERALKNLRTTLNYVHNALEPTRTSGDATWYVRADTHQVRLLADTTVDLWEFRRLIEIADQAESDGRPNVALPALIEAARLWRGDLACDLDHEWLDLERIHLRSRYLRVCCRAAELLIATGDAVQAIEMLQQGLRTDPWHERAYVALIAAYEADGDLGAARSVAAHATDQLGHAPRHPN